MTLLSLPGLTVPLHVSTHFRGKMQSLDICLILLLSAGRVAAQQDGVCYILDGILIVYGIVLTVLYCRLKMRSSGDKEKRDADIYQDLGRRDVDTYDTLHPGKKKPGA